MTIPRDQLNTIYLAAMMYYVEGKTQNQIADSLGISRPTVSRLLAQARDEGIVQIRVINPFATSDALTGALQDALGLDMVFVVPGSAATQAQARVHLSHAAARFLESTLQRHDAVGIGWGRTLYAVAEALEPVGDYGLSIFPLLGGADQISPSFQVHTIARMFSERLGGMWQSLYAPAITENESTRELLLASRDVARIIEAWSELDVVIVGIGNMPGPDVQILFADYLDTDMMKRLERAEAVGDICMHFFDSNGQEMAVGFSGVVSIELDQLKQVPRRIGVAGGVEKAEAIIGAARGGFINILATDEAAAQRILEILGISTERIDNRES
jgi:deoxyribonucleoside regulator